MNITQPRQYHQYIITITNRCHASRSFLFRLRHIDADDAITPPFLHTPWFFFHYWCLLAAFHVFAWWYAFFMSFFFHFRFSLYAFDMLPLMLWSLRFIAMVIAARYWFSSLSFIFALSRHAFAIIFDFHAWCRCHFSSFSIFIFLRYYFSCCDYAGFSPLAFFALPYAWYQYLCHCYMPLRFHIFSADDDWYFRCRFSPFSAAISRTLLLMMIWYWLLSWLMLLSADCYFAMPPFSIFSRQLDLRARWCHYFRFAFCAFWYFDYTPCLIFSAIIISDFHAAFITIFRFRRFYSFSFRIFRHFVFAADADFLISMPLSLIFDAAILRFSLSFLSAIIIDVDAYLPLYFFRFSSADAFFAFFRHLLMLSDFRCCHAAAIYMGCQLFFIIIDFLFDLDFLSLYAPDVIYFDSAARCHNNTYELHLFLPWCYYITLLIIYYFICRAAFTRDWCCHFAAITPLIISLPYDYAFILIFSSLIFAVTASPALFSFTPLWLCHVWFSFFFIRFLWLSFDAPLPRCDDATWCHYDVLRAYAMPM